MLFRHPYVLSRAPGQVNSLEETEDGKKESSEAAEGQEIGQGEENEGSKAPGCRCVPATLNRTQPDSWSVESSGSGPEFREARGIRAERRAAISDQGSSSPSAPGQLSSMRKEPGDGNEETREAP